MLRINTTPGQIGIKTKWATLDLKQPKADMDVKTDMPKVQIKTTDPKIKIDQKQCFAEAGIKSPIECSRENSQIARSAAMQGIARRADEGNQLADIHLGGDPIVEQAAASGDIFLREFVFGFIPKSRPKIDVVEGKVDVKYIPGKVNLNVKVNKPILNVNHGKVDIYMKQWPDIKIEYFGESLDTKL